MSVLRVCMRDVIERSRTFCVLILFMCSILCRMCSGRSLCVACVLPFGMLCLSAKKMMFVNMGFAVYISW